MSESYRSLIATSRLTLIGALLLIFGLGLAIRLYDLTDLPLDFHPTRQLLSELKARGMYYQHAGGLPDWQRKMAIQQWKSKAEVEPEVFERLVAFTYRYTGVHTWVARVYSSVFWLFGALFLFLLSRRLVSTDAALIAAAYFVFYPYGVLASRSFQPDILMVSLILGFWWMIVRWAQSRGWAWAVLAGLVGGLAIYVKFVAAFFVLAAGLGAAFVTLGRRLLRHPQVWAMAMLGILPAGIYLYRGIVLQGFLGRQFSGRFIPGLLLSPSTYLQWAGTASLAAGALAIALGLLGLILVRSAVLRALLLGLWAAYLAYGLFFDYHIATHDYYQVPLIALVALSLTPVADMFSTQLAQFASGRWRHLAVLGILLYVVLSALWDVRRSLAAVDYRPETAMWAQIGERLDHGPNVVALTQDYGSRLAYWGWQNALIWPNSGDTDYHEARGASIGFEELFDKLTVGNTYFLVTDFQELELQPRLKERLSDYPLFAEGEGFVIYDLERRLDS